MKVFTSLFSKSDRRSTVRSGGRSSQRAKYPMRSQAPQKGEFVRSAKRENAQVGVFPCCAQVYLNRLPLFLWQKKAHKKSPRSARSLTKRNAASARLVSLRFGHISALTTAQGCHSLPKCRFATSLSASFRESLTKAFKYCAPTHR